MYPTFSHKYMRPNNPPARLSRLLLDHVGLGVHNVGAGGRAHTTDRDLDVLLGEVHVGREGRVRNPLRGRARRRLLHHAVHLLEGQALGLGNEEVGKGKRDAAEAAPHEEDVGLQVCVAFVGANEVWGDDADDLERG